MEKNPGTIYIFIAKVADFFVCFVLRAIMLRDVNFINAQRVPKPSDFCFFFLFAVFVQFLTSSSFINPINAKRKK